MDNFGPGQRDVTMTDQNWVEETPQRGVGSTPPPGHHSWMRRGWQCQVALPLQPVEFPAGIPLVNVTWAVTRASLLRLLGVPSVREIGSGSQVQHTRAGPSCTSLPALHLHNR